MSYLTFCPIPLAEVLLTMLFRRFYGGYAFLKYGTVGRALQDLTGAVVQSVPASGPLLGGAVPRSTLLIAISSSVSILLNALIPFASLSLIYTLDSRRRTQNGADLAYYQNIRIA